MAEYDYLIKLLIYLYWLSYILNGPYVHMSSL